MNESSDAGSLSASRPALLALALALALPLASVAVALAVADVSRDFALLGRASALALVGLTVALSWLALRARSWIAVILLAGAAGAFGIRGIGYDGDLGSPSRETTERLAESAKRRFATIVDGALRSVRELAGDPRLLEAASTSSPESVATAFDVLAENLPPEAHPSGETGAALFDAERRPLAWAGANGSISWLSSLRRPVLAEELAVLESGPDTSLVAAAPLPKGAGFVSVEVPLEADRRLENRYLEDFDALSASVGRTVVTRFVSAEIEAEAIAALLEREGDPYWSTSSEVPRLYFGLVSPTGATLGLGAIAGETPESARLESRRRFALASALVLVLAAGAALALLAARRSHRLLLLLGIWGFRLVLRHTDFPLDLGLGLDNPAHYASSLLFGLARSPMDFLVTALALLASARILSGFLESIRPERAVARLAAGALSVPAAVVLFLGVQQVVLDAWLNSNLALSELSLPSGSAPRATVQLGLVALFASAAWLSHSMLSLARGPFGLWLAFDGLVVLAFYVVLAPRSSGDAVLLSSIPLVLLHLSALLRHFTTELFARRKLTLRVPAALVLAILGVVSFYPAVAFFESATVRTFIESTVTPVLLNHRRARMATLLETAATIDRMYEEGLLGDLGREDLAFRIWVSTDLAVSSLSSAVEVVDRSRRVVSRFALSLPALEFPSERQPAPDAWIPEERSLPGDPTHPGLVTARRTFAEGEWEIRVRLAADWRNLPFISTSDPYLPLFRTSALEAPLRFPHQELELIVLSPEGETVFQSVGGTIQPGAAILEEAMERPLWWQHPHDDHDHKTFLVGDGEHVYTLSYHEKTLPTRVAELSLWVFLTGAVGGIVFLGALVLGAFGSPIGVPPSELYRTFAGSFSAKLYGAFVLIALVPIVSLAIFIRGFVIQELERDVEREGLDRARLAGRIVRELHLSGPTSAVGTAPMTDDVLEDVRALAGVDVDIYVGGELLATSKPELVASGLVPMRAAPAAHREIVVERKTQAVHRESVGSFQYLVVSVPIVLPPWLEPGILSLPLASREAEIERKVASLNETVLLAAIAFSLVAAGVAWSVAHRIGGPINELTDATRAVAEGSLDVSLDTRSRDEIGALFRSFNRMTADLKRQREDLEKTKKLEAWAEMARQVAHEIKNPLTPIQLSTQHLLRVYGDGDVDFEKVLRECSDTILQQVKALRQISMEFSTFASPGPLSLELTDVGALVRDTVEPYRKSHPDGVRVRVDVAPDAPRTFADPRLLQRTFVNLVENALLAVNGRGSIDVELTHASSNGRKHIEVVVRDDGVGIPAEVKERVFEPYFSTRSAGTGLGLAIAKKVVEDHGGTITLDSEPGRGTEVRLRLPAAESDSVADSVAVS